jgi:hypothetical protein
MGSFDDAGQARTHAAINGVSFDNQDDYCEACRTFHVGCSHQQAVPVECGEVAIQGFDVVMGCNRPPHEDIQHRMLTGSAWITPPSPGN